jgi:hypothetical protein
MPSTYSPLKIQLMATGENNTTWGDVTNLNLGTAIEEAIVGSADVTFASGDVTLTLTDTNASQTARNMRLRCTGTTGGARNLIVPSIEKPYIVKNDCADSVTVKTAAGTGIAVPAGKTMWVYTDGTNVVDAVTHLSSLTLDTDLAVAQGGTGASTFTSNGVLYGNGASALQVTAAGTTGQVLVGNTGSAPSWATLTSTAVTSISFGTTGLTPSTATQGAVTVAGTLGVANGGTGTATQFTAGSVVFAGASGVYTQDNAQLFWDNTNDRLGIGTATPGAKLSVVGTAKIGEGAASNTAKLMVNTISGASAGIQLFQDGNESWIIENPASTTALTFANSGTERMRITGAGDVLVGKTAASVGADGVQLLAAGYSGFSAAGTTALFLNRNTNDGTILEFGRNGVSAATMGLTSSALTFGTAGSERMRIDSSGNLLVGGTTAVAKLTVTGNIATNSAQSYIYSNGGSGSSVQSGFFLDGSGNTLQMFTNTTERMRIDASGNVGIGTSNPVAKLSISAAGAAGLEINPTGGVGGGATIATYNRNTTAYTSLTTYASAMTWYANGSTRAMDLDSSGNLGIGTSSPGAKLETSVTSAGATAEVLRLSNPGSGANTQAQLNFYTTSTSYATITGGYGASAPQMTFNLPSVTAGNYVWQISSSEKMRLDTSGNLGIGTSSPGSKLTINDPGTGMAFTNAASGNFNIGLLAGTGSALAYVYQRANSDLIFGTNNAERMRIAANGYVGIGTASPDSKLHVAGTGGEGFVTVSDNTQATIRLSMSGGAQSDLTMTDLVTILRTNAAQPLLLSTNATERMRIDSSGNVGIGTSSPSYTLDVSASGTISGRVKTSGALNAFYMEDAGTTVGTLYIGSVGNDWRVVTGSNERMRVTSAGSVGIGTTAPDYTVDVRASASNALRVGSTNNAFGALLSWDNPTGEARLSSLGAYVLTLGTNSTERMRIDTAGNVQVGTGAIATTATDGFLYIPTCAGTPTGTPTAKTGLAPMVVDSTNNKLYVYVGGAWQAMN